MAKYYAYHYPTEGATDVRVVMSLRQILHERTVIAECYGRGNRSAEQAVIEWIMVHWAYPCTKQGDRLPGEQL